MRELFMISVETFSEFEASSDVLWELVGRFDGLPRWMPKIDEFQSDGSEIGSFRTFRVSGRRFRERLETLNTPDRTYSYSLVESPLSLSNYRATLAVSGNRLTARMCLSSQCEPVGDLSEEAARKMLTRMYEVGLRAVREILEGSGVPD